MPVGENELDSCRKRYYQILPESKMYAKMHDFNFYKIQIKNVRWIGGFGKIAWLDVSDWVDRPPKWCKSEVEIIEHMNEDHSDTIVAALKAQHNVDDITAKMVQLKIDGYYLRTKSELFL